MSRTRKELRAISTPSREDVPADIVAKEREIALAQLEGDKKPKRIKAKIDQAKESDPAPVSRFESWLLVCIGRALGILGKGSDPRVAKLVERHGHGIVPVEKHELRVVSDGRIPWSQTT